MFTGIIQQTGIVAEVTRVDGAVLWVGAKPWDEPFAPGESIAVDGVCLTLTERRADRLRFDILEETLRRTTLGELQTGDNVNLERALRMGDRMGGHIVNGHVDGVGEVVAIEPDGRDRRWTVRCEPELRQGVVFKGCVACQGVSLTVAGLAEDTFEVCLIPETLQRTSLGGMQKGGRMNLEVDVIGKYVRAWMGAIPDCH
jgi:riboflavin synthase